MRKLLPRAKVLEFFAQLPPCLIGIEACGRAHYWAREFTRLGHTVKSMAGRYVMAYRKRGKNDTNDAEAICEAVGRPNMRFVAVKSQEQQAVLMVHRARTLVLANRSAQADTLATRSPPTSPFCGPTWACGALPLPPGPARYTV